MGATYLVLNTSFSELSSETMLVTEMSRETLKQPFLQLSDCQVGKIHPKHHFLYMPECPILLLGRDYKPNGH